MQDRYLCCPPTFFLAPQCPPTLFILESPLVRTDLSFLIACEGRDLVDMANERSCSVTMSDPHVTIPHFWILSAPYDSKNTVSECTKL